jgi:hypothetical protein
MKTISVRVFTDDLPLIEQYRRQLSVERGGRRVTMAEAIRWLLAQAEVTRKAARPGEGE